MRRALCSCVFTALNAIGPLKAIAVALKLPKAFSVGVKLVSGFSRFREVDAAARGVLERVTAKLRDVFSRLRNPCAANSFTPDTPVLMADGTTKAIKDVRIGDLVLFTDPLNETLDAQLGALEDLREENCGQIGTLNIYQNLGAYLLNLIAVLSVSPVMPAISS